MESKVKYKTKQKEMILDLFKNNPGRHFTASDICRNLNNIGQATVYRKLEDLVSEGILEKFITDPSSPACFELSEHEGKREHCHHMRCTECGSLIHLKCEELDDITKHLKHIAKLEKINIEDDAILTIACTERCCCVTEWLTIMFTIAIRQSMLRL